MASRDDADGSDCNQRADLQPKGPKDQGVDLVGTCRQRPHPISKRLQSLPRIAPTSWQASKREACQRRSSFSWCCRSDEAFVRFWRRKCKMDVGWSLDVASSKRLRQAQPARGPRSSRRCSSDRTSRRRRSRRPWRRRAGRGSRWPAPWRRCAGRGSEGPAISTRGAKKRRRR